MEYRAALGLELWKAKEEERFNNDLKLREQKMLMVFAAEWKRREDERESLFRKKVGKYDLQLFTGKAQNYLMYIYLPLRSRP